MRLPLATVLSLLVVSGCQCFTPVSDDRDGGVGDGGRDAGLDAGPLVECSTAAQCSTTGALPACGTAAMPARSCFDHRCIYDCNTQPRTCTTNNGLCLECDGGPNTCAANCGILQSGEVGRLYQTCPARQTVLLGGYRISYMQGATCNFVISTDAGITGTVDEHGGDPSSVAQLSIEPGVSCSVTTLATALNRTVLGCAQCLYVLESP